MNVVIAEHDNDGDEAVEEQEYKYVVFRVVFPVLAATVAAGCPFHGGDYAEWYFSDRVR